MAVAEGTSTLPNDGAATPNYSFGLWDPDGEDFYLVRLDNVRKLTATPTVSTSPAYTSGDLVGGKISLASATRVAGGTVGGTGVIQSVAIHDKGKQNAEIDVVFFAADPANTTFTDNGALTVHDTDLLTIVGHVKLTAADYISFVDNSIASRSGLGLPFKLDSGSTLYAALVTRGTPTYASTSDIKLVVHVMQW